MREADEKRIINKLRDLTSTIYVLRYYAVQRLQRLPGIPTSTCAPCRPHRRYIAPGVSRVSACPRTLPRSLLAPPHCRRNPRRAFYRWGALRWAQNDGAQGYFRNLASCLPSWLRRNSCKRMHGNVARDSQQKLLSFILTNHLLTYETAQRRAYVRNSIRKCAKVNESCITQRKSWLRGTTQKVMTEIAIKWQVMMHKFIHFSAKILHLLTMDFCK